MKRQVFLVIYGLVQGVGYRFEAQKKAKELGLVGYVKNLQDGSVEILAQGPEKVLDSFIEWCRKGPEDAEVEEVEVKFLDEVNEELCQFEIRK